MTAHCHVSEHKALMFLSWFAFRRHMPEAFQTDSVLRSAGTDISAQTTPCLLGCWAAGV